MNEAKKFMNNWLENKKKNKMKKKELIGNLGTLYSYALAHMQHMGVSKEKREKFKKPFEEIVALIKKEVTEEWYDEKARELIALVPELYNKSAKEFIRKIVKEIQG